MVSVGATGVGVATGFGEEKLHQSSVAAASRAMPPVLKSNQRDLFICIFVCVVREANCRLKAARPYFNSFSAPEPYLTATRLPRLDFSHPYPNI